MTTSGHPDTPSGQSSYPPGHPIPGIRYRRERREHLVPHTINGETRMVPDEYDTYLPLPPRDWDRIALHAVTGLAVLLLVVSVSWSTASVGDLLTRTAPTPVAYLTAIAYDLPWIICMALEWLARYDPDRAKTPRRVGHGALIIAMAAVCVHGKLEDSLTVGIIGAAVSALAKTMWTLVLRQHARPLDARTRAWLTQREAEAGARLALAFQQRQQIRADGQHAALLAATGRPDVPDTTPDMSGQPNMSGPDTRASGTVRSGVRAAADTLPDATPGTIADHLSAVGITVDADTVSALLNEGATQPERAGVRPIAPPGQTVADSVRTAIASGLGKEAAVRYVSELHPDSPTDTIRRTYSRITTTKESA